MGGNWQDYTPEFKAFLDKVGRDEVAKQRPTSEDERRAADYTPTPPTAED